MKAAGLEVGRSGDFSSPQSKGKTGGKTGGKARGHKIPSDHDRGGTGARGKITPRHVRLLRPASVGDIIKFFVCPNAGCDNVLAFSGEPRWLYDLRNRKWVAVGPRCRKGTCSQEMVSCRDGKGVERCTKGEMRALPFIGNKTATEVVQQNQGAYAVWLKDEPARLEEEKRYLEYGTETESDVDFNDAQTWLREDSPWR